MKSLPAYPLTEEHLLAFGGIVQQFARFERLVEIAVSAFLNQSSYVLTAMTMASLGYSAKCDALKSLITLSGLTDAQKAIFKAHIDTFNEFSGLRNSIAHHVWKEGAKAGTVKALSMTSRGGTGKLKGIGENDTEYALEDLFNAHNLLNQHHDTFRGFLITGGFMKHMFENTDASSSASGSPSNEGG